MKTGFYPKLAWTGIYKNRQVYFPYILTCIGMIIMCYVMSYLSVLEDLKAMPGGSTMASILSLGKGVLAIFSVIFLFYTNSFLIRRRKKEFGLYNILGMGKSNLVRIQIWESLITAVLSMGLGLVFGIAFSKLVELVVRNVLHANISFAFSVPAGAVLYTLKVFCVIFVIIFISSAVQIRTTNPIELLHSENAGEKRPRANWLLAILGIVTLGGAYFLAVSIDDPVAALAWFFVAVIMVIAATYLLFIAGSVVFCYLLQKRPGYYYKTKHFISVSSMIYRMKRNGAGLASICILSTMVLVMVSSTTCLYLGEEDILSERYIRDFTLDFYSSDDAAVSGLQEEINKIANDRGLEPENSLYLHYVDLVGFFSDEHMIMNPESEEPDSAAYSQMKYIQIIPIEDYNRLMKKNETPAPGECIIYPVGVGYDYDSIDIKEYGKLTVKKQVDEFTADQEASVTVGSSLFIFTPDYSSLSEKLGKYIYKSTNTQMASPHIFYGFDLECPQDEQVEIYRKIFNYLEKTDMKFSLDSRAKEADDFFSVFGSLFILGVLLGIVFIVAMILIMYYKQISEGYEDQERFAILQKVGMTKKEIRQSVNSQVLTVFFLPLVTAGIHLLFSFPMVSKLLKLFALQNTRLLIVITLCCYLVFALFYVIVYYITSHSYYRLVSGGIKK